MDARGVVRKLPPLAVDLVGRHLGRYQVLGQIAAGGMAGVYVARAHGVAGFERLVAIKVLHPHLAYDEDFISMFLDEARLAARIRHPNVVATLDVSESKEGGYFLVMELIEGVNLATLLRQAIDTHERLPEPVVLRMVLDGLAGLGAAHELTDERGEPLRLVHRDVSPHNVMVGVDGIARLTDFGVASAAKRLTSTRQGTFKGKVSYSAPEQVLQKKVDGRADLFAMGIVFWECLTSRRLFRADDEAATLQKLLHEPIPAPSTVSPDLAVYDDLLAKTLEREPDRRFQTALEVIEAIEGLGRPIARARTVGEQVRQRAASRLAEQAEVLHGALAEYGSAAIEPPPPAEPRVFDADATTVAGTDVTHVARKQPPGARADEASATGSLSVLVQKRPRAVVAIVAILALALAAMALVAALGSRPGRGTPATRPPPAKTAPADSPRDVQAAEEARPSAAPPATATPASPSAEPAAPTEGAAAKRPRSGPHKRRDPPSNGPSDPEEEILLNPYRH